MEKGLVSSKVFVIALVISHPALGVMMQQAIRTVLGHFLRDTYALERSLTEEEKQ